MRNPRQSLQKTRDQLQRTWQALSTEDLNQRCQRLVLAILNDSEEHETRVKNQNSEVTY